MPELPEVESVRLSLLAALIGARIGAVTVYRHDIILTAGTSTPISADGLTPGPQHVRAALLADQQITALSRRGKQLLIHAESGQALGVHLGMTGQLRLTSEPLETPAPRSHIHIVWQLVDNAGKPTATMYFRDPRRFGEVRTFAAAAEAAAFADRLGPDALAADGAALWTRLHGSTRAIKAALLDQAVLAGVGNIYADEALFAAGVRPSRRCSAVSKAEMATLAAAIRTVLGRAIAAGGSTLRDYANAQGTVGTFATEHAVYGRGSQPCIRCGTLLRSTTIAQRTTVYCSRCQR